MNKLIEAYSFRNCGVAGAFDESTHSSAILSPENSYLTKDSSPYKTDNLWNKVAAEIHDLVDIWEYLEESRRSEATIRGYTYSKEFVFDEAMRRSMELSMIMSHYRMDHVRGVEMPGLASVLGSNYSSVPVMVGKDHYSILHTFSALEAMARCFSIAGTRNDAGLSSIFLAYEPDWDGVCYRDPAEEMYKSTSPVYIAYNMAASVGMACREMSQATRNLKYFDRAVQLAKFVEGAYCDKWWYSAVRDRTEDPDHAAEVLRFAMYMEPFGLFNSGTLSAMLSDWFNYGVSSDKQFLTERLEPGSPSTSMTTKSVAARMSFLFKHDADLYRKVLSHV